MSEGWADGVVSALDDAPEAAADPDAAATAAQTATSRAGTAPWLGAGLVVLLLGAATGPVALRIRHGRKRRGSVVPELDEDVPSSSDAEAVPGEPQTLEPLAPEAGP